MDSYVRIFTDNEMYKAKVTIKSFLNSAVNIIKKKLSTTQLAMFDKTCYGHFLQVNELQFSGQVVNYMLWRQCICDDPDIMVFNFGGSGARFTIQEFCLISGLFYGPVPSTRPTSSRRFRDTYFGGRKFPLHNHDIVEVFMTATCEDNEDMVKLALLYFLEIVILSKEMPKPMPVERVDVLDDIKYFLTYPWGTLSFHATIKSMCDCLNWTIGQITNKNKLEDIFSGQGGTSVDIRLCAIEERLSIMDSRLSSMDNKQSSMDNRLSSMESRLDSLIKLLSSTYNTTGVQLDEDGDQCFDEVRGEDVGVGDAHRMCDQKINHAANHLVPPVSISSSPIAKSEHSVKVFTQMSNKKLAGGRRKRRPAQTTESPYDCQSLRRKIIRTLPVSGSVTFDPYRSVPDEITRQYAHFMDMSADDHTVELFWITVGKKNFRHMEFSLNWLTSDAQLVGYPHFKWEVQSSSLLLSRTLVLTHYLVVSPVRGRWTPHTTVDSVWSGGPYKGKMDPHMETVTHLIRQRIDKYPEVFDFRILLLDNRLSQYMEARLDFFNENKETYDFGEEILEFLNGKEPMMKIKPYTITIE
ncbi:hypothetical protein FNV43_RR07420 [Rhamnella rubrinervis]|uniref:DUF1985 domain-containing protein n=1 Tax=Rhamnella rubrinervis TaxID=2594499 RepID=A0A8K0MMY6_9ROSA|nr:hypothetical protein FNV43_RR07420 [Rhamnella rubrinervis]